MDIEVSFPGGKRVDAWVKGFVVHTDQPVDHGGNAEAVTPFDLFLASLATCAGYHVMAFCQARKVSTEGLALRQRVEIDPRTRLPSHVHLELHLPASFPKRYRVSVVRAAERCEVGETIGAAPNIDVIVVPAETRPPKPS